MTGEALSTTSPPRRRKWLRRGLVALAILVLAGLVFLYAGVTLWLPWVIVVAPNHGNVALPEVEAAPNDHPPIDGVTEALRVSVGPPDASLSMWLMEPSGPAAGRTPKGTVLVLHGIRDRKRTMAGIGRWFADAGYRAVLVDLRGHGESTGDYLSYGAFDGRDLSKVLDGLAARGLLTGPVDVYGPSYGGAAALQLAAADDRVEAVVVIATFSRMRDIVPVYVRKFLPFDGLISDDRLQRAVDGAGEIGRYDPDDADSVAAIARTRAAVLIIHGDADTNIPLAQGRALRDAAAGRCELVTVPGADHASIFKGETGRDSMRRAIRWFDEHLPPR